MEFPGQSSPDGGIYRILLAVLLLCSINSGRYPVADPRMTNADIINELKLLKDRGYPVSAMVILYAGMVNVHHFDGPGCTAKDAALTLLQMVKTSPDSSQTR